MISLNNGWTYVWQGSEPSLFPKDKPTIRNAIEQKVGAENFTYFPGTRIVRKPDSPSNSNPTDIDEEVSIEAAVTAAEDADVVVLCAAKVLIRNIRAVSQTSRFPQLQLDLAER